MTSRRFSAFSCLALLLLISLTYWPGLSGRFIFDDFPNIVSNGRIHAISLDWRSLKEAAGAYQPGSYGRPLATVSFAIDHSFWGTDPWGYKLSSLLVHLVNALLVFTLVSRLLGLALGPRQRFNMQTLSAFVIALLWAVHPLQVSTVLYVVQRMEMLSVTFVLFALLAYLRGRTLQRDASAGWKWIGCSAGLAAVGMLSKETAVLFPLYTLALELTVLRFEAEQRTRIILKSAYALGLVIALTVFLFWVIPHYASTTDYASRDFTATERLLSQLRIIPKYIGQMLFPHPGTLPFYYDTYEKSTGWLSPGTTLAGGLFLSALLASAGYLRRRAPLVSLGILWFFAAHALTSNVLNLELVFEHRNYFALLGILICLADLVRRIPMRDGLALKYIAIFGVVVGFGFLTLLRTATWGSALQLAMDLAAKNPASTRASMDLGTIYVVMSDSNPDSPFFAFAETEFERGSRLPRASPLPEQGLILMAATTGRPVKDEWWARLIHKLKTRPIGPEEIATVTGLMKQRYEGIEMDDHRLSQAYATLLSRPGMPPQLYAQFGDYALAYLNDPPLADRMFVAAIDRAPGDATYAAKIFTTLTVAGHIRQATAVSKRARELGLVGGQVADERSAVPP